MNANRETEMPSPKIKAIEEATIRKFIRDLSPLRTAEEADREIVRLTIEVIRLLQDIIDAMKIVEGKK
jgi:hypothetical protein